MASTLLEGDSHLPLRGIVLCSTGLTQDVRTELENYAVEMGARYVLDLTGEVTHLIVADVRTPKYRYVARSRPDIKVLHQDWVREVRKQWLDGEDVDVQALADTHRQLTFAGLSICVTGFSDPEARTRLEETFTTNGATYWGDLTKQITHLVVAAPQGAKYNAAKQWDIKCVTLDWMVQSVQRGMALSEQYFDPSLPAEQQGVGAMDFSKHDHKLGKRLRGDEHEDAENSKRKFRRTASERLGTHSQDLWHGISTRDEHSGTSRADQWDESGSLEAKQQSVPAAVALNLECANPSNKRPRLFSGMKVHIHGFDSAKTAKLKEVLQQQCGADVVASQELQGNSDAAHCFVVLPHQPPASAACFRSDCNLTVATEWWVERCIYAKNVLDPTQDHFSQPFWDLSLLELKGMTISSTGLTSLDLRQTAALVTATGAVYHEKLSSHTSVLLCASHDVKKEKAYYAAKHAIPLVSMDWLWSCIKHSSKQPFEHFHIPYPLTARSDGKEGTPSASVDRSTNNMRSRTAASSKHTKTAGSERQLNKMPKHKHRPVARTEQQAKEAPPAKSGPFMDDDSERPSQNYQAPVREVLKERSPNMISPAKRSPGKPVFKESTVSPPKVRSPRKLVGESRLQLKPLDLEHSAPDKERLNEELKALSRQLSMPKEASNTDQTNARRRKRGLGRAASAISHRSTSASIEYAVDELDPFHDDTEKPSSVPVLPSTQLGYEVPETEAHRQEMAKKLGTSFASDVVGKKLEGLGTVKDSDGRRRRPAR